MTALEVLLDYLGRQWLPVPVKEAYDRVQHEDNAKTQEMERLKARLRSDAAYF